MCKPAFRDFAKELTEDVILEAKEKGYTIEDLAELIGVSKYSISHYLYDDKVPSLPAFIGLYRKTKSEKALKKLASWSGYVVIKLPEIDHQYSLISRQTAKVMRETADVIEAVGKALEDGKLTEPEKRTVVKEIDEAIEELLKLKHSIEVER